MLTVMSCARSATEWNLIRAEVVYLPAKHNQRRCLMYKRLAVLLIAAAVSAPAVAEEVGVGVGVGPFGAGVTVGSGPDRVVREREVIREREPRAVDKKVIIEKDRRPDVVEKKTIIKERD